MRKATKNKSVFLNDMALYNIMIMIMEKPGWGNELADEPLTYGQQLMTIAGEIDSENNRLYLKELWDSP
ncbi:hypothetical protein [Candidatus Cardinium hertigii]|nr:hypothetical protein [Candidatus Cardinium hertigii]